MLYAKHITTKSNDCTVNDNKMFCTIFLISKEPRLTQFINGFNYLIGMLFYLIKI